MKLNEKIIMWIVWKFPPDVLRWTIVRVANMAMDKFNLEGVDSITYPKMYEAIESNKVKK